MTQLIELVDELETNLDLLDAGSRHFAESLIAAFREKKKLSDKQAYWVNKLIERAVMGRPIPESVDLGADKVKAIKALFDSAASKLKWPKLNLETEDGYPVQLSVAGPKAKRPGTINITDGGPYGSNVWYGRLDPETGEWEKPMKEPEGLNSVTKMLRALAANPHNFATLHGHKTGKCCFCAKKLTHDNSVTVGYGPTCAQNWGLSTAWANALKEKA